MKVPRRPKVHMVPTTSGAVMLGRRVIEVEWPGGGWTRLSFGDPGITPEVMITGTPVVVSQVSPLASEGDRQ